MTKPQKYLIGLLEGDIEQAGAAIISLEVDIDLLNDKRKGLQDTELKMADDKLIELRQSLDSMNEQESLLNLKLRMVKEYGKETPANS